MFGGVELPLVREAALCTLHPPPFAGANGEVEQREGDSGGAVRVAAEIRLFGRPHGRHRRPRPAVVGSVRLREKVLAEAAGFVQIAIAAEEAIDRGEAEDRAGRAADDVERHRIDRVSTAVVEQTQRLALERRLLQQTRDVDQRPGNPRPAAVEGVPELFRQIARERKRLADRPARRVGQERLGTEPIQPGQEEGDAARAGVELGTERLVRPSPLAGVRFHRIAEPVAARAVPDRVAAETHADRPRHVEEALARIELRNFVRQRAHATAS